MQASFQSHNKLVHLVGVGSLCGDDSIGLCIAKRIEHQACHGIASRSLRVDFATSPIRLLDLVLHADTLVICDAWLADNAPIGTIRRWAWPNIEI
jgi:Ni,Fe-hydrogenase maturation factor